MSKSVLSIAMLAKINGPAIITMISEANSDVARIAAYAATHSYVSARIMAGGGNRALNILTLLDQWIGFEDSEKTQDEIFEALSFILKKETLGADETD